MKFDELFKIEHIRHIFENNGQNDLYAIEACYEKKPIPPITYNPNIASFFSLHLVVAGSGTYKCKHGTWDIAINDMFLLFPNAIMEYEPNTLDYWSYAWINIEGVRAKQIFSKTPFSPSCPVYKNASTEIVQEYLNLFHSLATEKKAKNLVMSSHLYKILSLLVNASDDDIEKIETGKKSHISKAVQYINDNIGDPDLSLINVSKFLSINPSYLSRLFKDIMGTPFSKYLILTRIQNAYGLIEKGETSVSHIAEKVGYSNPFYFSKEFKRHKGFPPSEYVEFIQRGACIDLVRKDKKHTICPKKH